ncbi:hypothetical protein ES705_43758 [subsurface metagenome]
MEIEKWDHSSEKAWLWVKIPNIVSGTDTEIWIYYDKTKADNTAYVGDPSDAVVHNVWDVNHKLSTHMRDDPDTSHVRDSTVNANDGTKKAANEPIVTTAGKIDDAQDFDGTDDKVEVPDAPSISGLSAITVEAWVKMRTSGDYEGFVSKYGTGGGGDVEYILGFSSGGNIRFRIYTSTDPFGIEVTSTMTLNAWHHVVGTYDGTNFILYRDGANVNSGTSSGNFVDAPTPVTIGSMATNGYFSDGIIDEPRISDSARTPAWIKASYESGRDHLLDFGSEEEYIGVTQTISGTLTFTGTLTTVLKRLFRQAEVSIAVNQSVISTKENDSVLAIDANKSVLSIKE